MLFVSRCTPTLLAAILCLLPLTAATAKIKSTSGQVTILEIGDDGRETPRGEGRPGRTVSDGETLVTASGASAVLSYEDGTEITLKSGSRLTVGAQDDSKGFLTLLSGSILAKVKKLSSSDQFSVVTPTAIAGVRGTTFAVTVGEGGDTHVGVEEGKVQVDDADGDESSPGALVAGGEAAEAGLSGKPTKSTGFKMEGFNHEAWMAGQRARFEQRLPEVMAAMEGRFKLTAFAMIKSQEAFQKDMEKLKEVSDKIAAAKARGKEIPEEAHAIRMALTIKVAGDAARLKMVGQRMQAFGPVLNRMSEFGKMNPRMAGELKEFATRTAGLRNKINESRKEFTRDMDKHKDFMRSEMREARERAGDRGKQGPEKGIEKNPPRGDGPGADRRQDGPGGDRRGPSGDGPGRGPGGGASGGPGGPRR